MTGQQEQNAHTDGPIFGHTWHGWALISPEKTILGTRLNQQRPEQSPAGQWLPFAIEVLAVPAGSMHGWGLRAERSGQVLEVKQQKEAPEALPGCTWLPVRITVLIEPEPPAGKNGRAI